jgi:ATP-dependent helicase/nuclease subunit A
MNKRPTLDDAILLPTRIEQARASDPNSSAWVTANAGSGKTHVLVQRVVRLLLSGVFPARILCLTFTKAAAANMAGRVFRMLADWTSFDDERLAEAIEATGAGRPGAAQLSFARQLFARTIETPGGLKIQTIHAFCERLLHLFPFEADVAAGFRVAEERDAAQLLAHARAGALARLMENPAGAAALADLAREAGEMGFDQLMREALSRRAQIAAAHGGIAGYRAALARSLGLAPGEDSASVEAEILSGLGGRGRWPGIAAQLFAGGSNDNDRGADLTSACTASDQKGAVAAYFGVFFDSKDEPRGLGKSKIITQPLARRFPQLLVTLEGERDRLIPLREKHRAARALERSVTLIDVARQILAAYQRLKDERAILDFDDLIERTLKLLQGPGAAWVLYKLDYGIDHILVDEAQDTSNEQWQILTQLAAEFTAGNGARKGARTFFAVGDEKQSIYSFQGAAPEMFAAKRRELGRKHDSAGLGFAEIGLTLSFRSAAHILKAVDTIYSVPETWRGVAAFEDKPPPHQAFHINLPGLVEVWEPVAGSTEKAADDWRMPLDAARATDPPVALARRIAGTITSWLAPGSAERVFGKDGKAPRPIKAGDIMILVRSRGAFFEAMIRSLKEAGVRVAGTDRLKLREHIAVMDLVAAGRAALTPADDLALAGVLKSPLIGLDDADLLTLAPQRQGPLAQALAGAAGAKFANAQARLETWRDRAQRQTPFAFYAWLLGEDGGRKALLARLGAEASEAIDEFLSSALDFERQSPASLALFLAEIEHADLEVKRDMESQGDSVRVMTIHAAKGLEASVVFLPDTCFGRDARLDPKLFELANAADGGPPLIVWSPRTSEDPARIAQARDASNEAASGEHRRLLYVAMTRAAERLIVCGFHGARPPGRDCWYDMVRTGLAGVLAASPAPWDPAENIWRMGAGARGEAPVSGSASSAGTTVPAWLSVRATPESGAQPLRASRPVARRLGDAASDARSRRLEAGRLAHALLQFLPEIRPDQRADAGERFVAFRAPDISPREREVLVRQAIAVVELPELSSLFGPHARAEVAIAANIVSPSGGVQPFSGRIDRIAVEAESVTIADFKSGAGGRTGEQLGYAAQLKSYRTALLPLYPDRRIRCLLVWLEGPQIIEI